MPQVHWNCPSALAISTDALPRLVVVRSWIKRGESGGGGLREPALLEEAGERGKIKSTAASSWWRVSMGARVIEKTERIPPPPPPPPASIPARRARLLCTPMASSPSRSPHTVMLETGRGIPQAVILQTVRIWIKRGESRGGGLREQALIK